MKKILSATAAVLMAGGLSAGTLVYRMDGGEQNIISNVTILSIDAKLITLSMENGIHTIPSNRLVKYYDSDIKVGGMFRDNTSPYSISISDIRVPQSTRKNSSSGSSRRSSSKANKVTLTYSITPGQSPDGRPATIYREPLFYLFVLTTDGGVRKVGMTSYPSYARVSSKIYDEAKMMEKALDLNRKIIHSSDRDRLGTNRSRGGENVLGGTRIELPLSNIADGDIIAWYLVVWGKDGIIYEKEETVTGESAENKWYMRNKLDK